MTEFDGHYFWNSELRRVNEETRRRSRSYEEVNWQARSLLAAASLAICAFSASISATTAVQRASEARADVMETQSQAALVADFTKFLAERTAAVRRGLDSPRLKPSPDMAGFDYRASSVENFVNFDFEALEAAFVHGADRQCLAQAIYYEARSEPRAGQMAVADVVLNRVRSGHYPDSICGVVFQGSERKTGCQFSFTCDGSMKARLQPSYWKRADDLAGAVLSGVRAPISRNATHYHAYYVDPPWAARLTPTATIGAHKFYKFPSRETLAAAPSTM